MLQQMKELKRKLKSFGYRVEVRHNKLSAWINESEPVFVIQYNSRYSLSKCDFHLWQAQRCEGIPIFEKIYLSDLIKYLYQYIVK